MTLSVADLEHSSTAVDAPSFPTGSLSVIAGRLIRAAIITDKSGAGNPTTPTINNTGTALTWTQQTNDIVGSSDRLTVFTAPALTTESIVITFDYGGETQTEACLSVVEWTDVHASTPVTQANSSTGDSATPNTTLAAFGAGGACDMIWGCSQSRDFAEEAGFTNIGRAVQSNAIESAFKLGEDTTPSGTHTSAPWALAAIEIGVAVAVNGKPAIYYQQSA